MKISRLLFLLIAACCAVLVSLASCSSDPKVLPAGLTAAEIFQRAQDASDRGDYPLAIRYYSTVETTHPDDINHITWAQYEIAFCYHKMGRNEMSLSLFNDLLAQYDKNGAALPPAPRVLALKLKAKLEVLTQKTK